VASSVYSKQFPWLTSRTLPSDIRERHVRRTTVPAFVVINPLIYDTRSARCTPGAVIFIYPANRVEISRAGRPGDSRRGNNYQRRDQHPVIQPFVAAWSAKTARSVCGIWGPRFYAPFSFFFSYTYRSAVCTPPSHTAAIIPAHLSDMRTMRNTGHPRLKRSPIESANSATVPFARANIELIDVTIMSRADACHGNFSVYCYLSLDKCTYKSAYSQMSQ